MNSLESYIDIIRYSRKRSGVIYCSSEFDKVITRISDSIEDLILLDCTSFYDNSLTYSASELLNKIESFSQNQPLVITNIETFIIANSTDFAKQLAKLLIVREPIRPWFFLFYSKRSYRCFRDQFEAEELTKLHSIEL